MSLADNRLLRGLKESFASKERSVVEQLLDGTRIIYDHLQEKKLRDKLIKPEKQEEEKLWLRI